MSNGNSNSVINHDFTVTASNEAIGQASTPHKKYNKGGGEPPMKDDYVTHEELDHAFDKLDSKIDKLETKIDGKFNVVDSKFDLVNQKIDHIPDQIKLALNETEKEKRKEHTETMHYLVGTITIGGLSVIAAIISIIISLH